MKNKNTKIKSYMGLMLTVVLMLGIWGNVPSDLRYVNASGENEPSVTAFAEKSELMSVFDLDGNDDTVGKIVFGKNEAGAEQEWYIAGKDTSRMQDNIILHAVKGITTEGKPFNSTTSNITDSTKWSDCNYAGATSITQVYANHYGTSEIRDLLQTMVSNNNYFTDVELNLMNSTTIKTFDAYNRIEYTTQDKLYLLSGVANENVVKAGANADVVISNEYRDKSDDWRSGYWIREPYENSSGMGYIVVEVNDYFTINQSYRVHPAVDINIESVLFASSAVSATTTQDGDFIASDKAMRLRMDGSAKTIGDVVFYNGAGKIAAEKANGAGNVALVVQGKDSVNGDWYYSKVIAETEEITVDDIKNVVGMTNDFQLSDCEIWLEIKEDNISYAKRAVEQEYIIEDVAVTDVIEPSGNAVLDAKAKSTTAGLTNESKTPAIVWKLNGNVESGNAKFNSTYTLNVTLAANDMCSFKSGITATINGETVPPENVIYNNDGTITLVKSYTSPKAKLISISAPSPVTGVANGTEKTAQTLGLPTTVVIQTEDANVTTANVAWDLNTLASGNYDPAVLEEQSFVVNGTVTLPTEINANGVGLNTTISVTVDEADTVEAPTVNVTPGTYDENQTVELSTGTTGATIYYTTDGSQPSVINGNIYNGAINISGTAGSSIQKIITAIAVKLGMFDSSIATFTYTINIPTYTLTVTNGSGSGAYAKGVNVTLTANTAPSGKQFKNWSGLAGLTLISGNANSQSVTFVMPAQAVNVTANYENKPVEITPVPPQTPPQTPPQIAETPDEEIRKEEQPQEDNEADVEETPAEDTTDEDVTTDADDASASDKESVEKEKYNVINDEQEQEGYIPKEDAVYKLQSDGDFTEFVSVEVDGVVLGQDCYTINESDNTIEFTAEYMMQLSKGEHTVILNFKDGSAKTEIKVLDKTISDENVAVEDDAPQKKSADKNDFKWIFIMCVAGIMLAGGFWTFGILRKKKNK